MPPKIRSRSAASDSSSTGASKKPSNNAVAPSATKAQQQQQQKQTQKQPVVATTGNLKNKPKTQQQQKQQQQKQTPKAQSAPAQKQTETKQNKTDSNTTTSTTTTTTTTSTKPASEEQWLQILIGSYHNAIQGYTFRLQRNLFLNKVRESLLSTSSNNNDRFLLKQPTIRFSGNQHNGCVHAVVSNGSSLVASSGSDERISLCSIKNHGTVATDLGSMLPASTVRALSFVSSGGGHLICGCDDGSLAVYRTRSWDCEAVLQVHTKAMLDFVMTKNGALVITIGQDRYLAFVDLMRGSVLHRHKFAPAIAKSKPIVTGTAAPPRTTMEETPEEEKKRQDEVNQMKAQQRFGFVNQPPTQLVLSPSGKTVAVIAPYYVAFFCLRTAQLVCTLEQEDPQPDLEHQSAAFVMTSPVQQQNQDSSSASASASSWHLILSTETGKMLACTEPTLNDNFASEAISAATQQNEKQTSSDKGEPVLCLKTSVWVDVREHPSVSEEVRARQFAQMKQSLYQVATNRIRCIAPMGGDAARCEGLVTASSGGEVRCWIAEEDKKLKMVHLYECTMPLNVSGRVTCISSSTI